MDAGCSRRAVHGMRPVCRRLRPKSLIMGEGIAVIAFPATCGSEEHCISVCRDDAIQMVLLPFSGDINVGTWSENIEQVTITGSTTSQIALE